MNFMQVFSLIIWATIYTSFSEDDNSSEYSSDFNNMNDRPTKKDVVTDSDTESKNETHGAGECSFASTE